MRGRVSVGDALLLGGAGLAALFFVLPLVGILARAPLLEVLGALGEARVQAALVRSLLVSSLAVALALLVGFPLALVLARPRQRGQALLRAVVALPLVFPPVVAGVGLLFVFGRRGLLGPTLEGLGVSLPFSLAGAVLAVGFVCAPFVVFSLEAGLASVDGSLLDAARSLGAGRWLTFRVVVLPALGPSLRAGVGLGFARALGEFGATITFAGNLEGRTQTLPLLIYESLHADAPEAAGLSLLLLVIAGLALLALRAWPGRR